MTRRAIRWRLTLVLLVVSSFLAPAAQAQTVPPRPVPGLCQRGTLPSGALWLICVPAAGWNGDLMVWAHGYVAFNQPLDFHHTQFDGTSLPTEAQRLGYAFATTSYRPASPSASTSRRCAATSPGRRPKLSASPG
jgi:hypothetical protein